MEKIVQQVIEDNQQIEPEIQIFKHEKFGELKMYIIDKIPYFVGNKVTEKLKYKNSSLTLKKFVRPKIISFGHPQTQTKLTF